MTLQIACLVFNSVCCVIAWTFVFLICRAEKRADAARKASIEATRQILDGPPVAGTTTGSSSPSTSSTSSPGKGIRCTSSARPGMDSPGGMVTGTANGALKKEPRRASTVTGSDEVLRNANAV